ncbi:MAG: hypothetical protein ACXVBO_07685, partial [Isosphaeraceae bacterium]
SCWRLRLRAGSSHDLGAEVFGLYGCVGHDGGRVAIHEDAHPNKVDYFVGPGGPVPLTPGYVPYIVATRSPRDFFAFPPMNPNDP